MSIDARLSELNITLPDGPTDPKWGPLGGPVS